MQLSYSLIVQYEVGMLSNLLIREQLHGLVKRILSHLCELYSN